MRAVSPPTTRCGCPSEKPSDENGQPLIRYLAGDGSLHNQPISGNVVAQWYLSIKLIDAGKNHIPDTDYYSKFTRYVEKLGASVKALGGTETACTHSVVLPDVEENSRVQVPRHRHPSEPTSCPSPRKLRGAAHRHRRCRGDWLVHPGPGRKDAGCRDSPVRPRHCSCSTTRSGRPARRRSRTWAASWQRSTTSPRCTGRCARESCRTLLVSRPERSRAGRR
jgi:hypothetical protein